MNPNTTTQVLRVNINTLELDFYLKSKYKLQVQKQIHINYLCLNYKNQCLFLSICFLLHKLSNTFRLLSNTIFTTTKTNLYKLFMFIFKKINSQLMNVLRSTQTEHVYVKKCVGTTQIRLC